MQTQLSQVSQANPKPKPKAKASQSQPSHAPAFRQNNLWGIINILNSFFSKGAVKPHASASDTFETVCTETKTRESYIDRRYSASFSLSRNIDLPQWWRALATPKERSQTTACRRHSEELCCLCALTCLPQTGQCVTRRWLSQCSGLLLPTGRTPFPGDRFCCLPQVPLGKPRRARLGES